MTNLFHAVAAAQREAELAQRDVVGRQQREAAALAEAETIAEEARLERTLDRVFPHTPPPDQRRWTLDDEVNEFIGATPLDPQDSSPEAIERRIDEARVAAIVEQRFSATRR